MAFDVEVHDSAKQAYFDIIEYLNLITGGTAASEKFTAEFDNQIGLISKNPELYGFSRDESLADAGYRAAFVNNYVMLYRIEKATVHVKYVFHMSQDYARYVS